MELCLVPWGGMDHTKEVRGVQSGELLHNHGSQIQGRQGDKKKGGQEKVRVATPVAGMPSAEVKGAAAKHGAERATCPWECHWLLFIPRDGTSSSCPPDPAVQDLGVALSPQPTVLETPQPWEGVQKHPAMGHSLR